MINSPTLLLWKLSITDERQPRGEKLGQRDDQGRGRNILRILLLA